MLNDLFETLDRMGIKPIGAASASVNYTEHRTVRAKKDNDKANAVETARGSVTQPASDVPEDDAGSRLVAGDRIVIKFLDDLKARPECYVMTSGPSDQVNGFLSLTCPLAQALSDATPGDEVTIQFRDRERPFLYLSLEREPRKAA